MSGNTPGVIKLNCTACGAPISVPDGLDFLNCGSCGSFLAIQRGDGYVALKVAEKLAQALEISGKVTQEVIRQGTDVTKAELQRLQLSQELSTSKMQLTNIQAEIRALSRTASTSVIVNQLVELHGSEFQVMERIRQINSQLSTPPENDIPALISYLENKIIWINAECQALQQSGFSNKVHLLSQLSEQSTRLQTRIYELKISTLKSKLPSYRIMENPANRQDALNSLQIIDTDLKYLVSLGRTPEVIAVQDDLRKRREDMYQFSIKLEQQRLDRLMTITKYTRSDEEMSSLREYLGILVHDISVLKKEPDNQVVQANISKLTYEKANIERQIKKLERKTRKVAQIADNETFSISNGKKAGLLAIIAAIFAAIAAKFSSKSSDTNADTLKESSHFAENPYHPETDENSAIPGNNFWMGLKTVVVGCVLALLMTFLFAVMGFITSSIFSTFIPAEETTAIVFLIVMSIGIMVSSRIFMRYITPGTIIRNLPIVHVVKFASRKKPKSIISPTVCKLIFSLLVGITIWLWGLTFFMIFTSIDLTGIAVLFCIIFFLAGIVFPILINVKGRVSVSTN